MRYLLLLVFLCSCQTQRVFQGERCQTFFKFDDAKRIILEESTCRCTDYKISLDFIGNINETVTRHPIEYCHGNIGFDVQENKNLTDFYFAVRDDIKADEQKKAREETNY